MRRRPQLNRRRGLLRATGVVVALTAILVAILFVVSSLTAPTAKAPVLPPTPGPVRVTPPATAPRATPAPTAPRATSRARSTHAHANPSVTPKRDVALGSPSIRHMAETRPLAALERRAGRQETWAQQAAWRPVFSGHGDAYHGMTLYLRDSAGDMVRIGSADPYVRPVWSATASELLYARVRAVPRFPGALWSLMAYDLASRTVRRLTAVRGMGLTPLGWVRGGALYALASATDTSLFSVRAGISRFVSILVPQPVNAPSLSPDGDHVAFLTPSDCTYCSLAVFDISALKTWFGPTGIPSADDVAWARSGHRLATILGRNVEAIDVVTHDVRLYSRSPRLPAVWHDPFSAAFSGESIILTDSESGRRYRMAPGS